MNPRAAKTTRTAATTRTRARSGPRRVPAGQIHSVNPTTGATLATFDLRLARGNPRRRLLVGSKGRLGVVVAVHDGPPSIAEQAVER